MHLWISGFIEMIELKGFTMAGWKYIADCRCKRSDDNREMTGKIYRNDYLDSTFQQCWLCNDEIFGTGLYDKDLIGISKRINRDNDERKQDAHNKKEIKKRTIEKKLQRD